MKKLICLIGAILVLSVSADAKETDQILRDRFGVETLYDAIPDAAEAVLNKDNGWESLDLLDGISGLLQERIQISRGTFGQAVSMMNRLVLILILCQLVETFSDGDRCAVTSATGVLAVTACCITDLRALVGLGKEAMNELSSFSTLLLPVMSAVSAASGQAGSAGSAYAVTVFFSNLLLQLGNNAVIPMVYAYVGLAAADAVLQQEKLKPFRKRLGWMVEWGMKGIVYGFIGILTITGTVSGTADAAAIKAAKTAITSFVPVVGGIISGAAETVLNSAGLLKQTVGTVGMISILAIFMQPFLEVGVSFLMLKVVAALSDILGSKLSDLLDGIGSALGYVLAMVGSSVLINLISCCSMMKVVNL